MIVINRTRNLFVTAFQSKVIKRAVEWAAKSGLFDQVKIVNVAHAPTRNGGITDEVRTCMARITTNGTRELWINLATTAYGRVTLGQVKRHVFSPEIAQALSMIKSNKADNSVTRLRARNRRHGMDVATEQHTSRTVVFTIDLLRRLPKLVMGWLNKDITSKRGLRVWSVDNHQSVIYDVSPVGLFTMADLLKYSTDLVSNGTLPLRTWMWPIIKAAEVMPRAV